VDFFVHTMPSSLHVLPTLLSLVDPGCPCW
jgi:hypothetical protein